MPSRDPSVWHGHAAVAFGGGGVLHAELVCPWGSVTRIVGTPDGNCGWILAVSDVVWPESMVVPWLDDPKGQG